MPQANGRRRWDMSDSLDEFDFELDQLSTRRKIPPISKKPDHSLVGGRKEASDDFDFDFDLDASRNKMPPIGSKKSDQFLTGQSPKKEAAGPSDFDLDDFTSSFNDGKKGLGRKRLDSVELLENLGCVFSKNDSMFVFFLSLL